MRICIYTKTLARRIDEGFLRVSHEVIHEIARHHEMLALFSHGDLPDEEGLERIPANGSGLSLRLRARVRGFRPDAILYVPRSGASLHCFWIARLLRCYGRGAPVVVLTTQPNDLALLPKRLVSLLKPDLLLAASTREQQALERKGCAAGFVPLGVDLEKFTPATPGRKMELRAKYGIGREEFVALHIGHMNEGRNIRALSQIQDNGNQVVIAASTFFAHNSSLIRDLEAHGVRFVTGYLDNVEEAYQSADCYVFPTVSERACIGQPLSVLEAMACNLPVVTTRFGGLPDLFPEEGGGLLYAGSMQELAARVSHVRDAFRRVGPRTREMVEHYPWTRTGREVLRFVEGLHSTDGKAKAVAGAASRRKHGNEK
jgi:glycosyltransferase involved in cell wall biosynthesis